MQHISNIAQKAAQNAAPESAHNSKPRPDVGSIPAKWVDALFARFARIWGEKWTDHVHATGGDVELAHEWREGLVGLTGEQIKHAIEYCRSRNTWPPSIAEFRQAARNGATGEQAAFAARLREADSAQRALPSETWAETKARGASRLAEIRNTLRNTNA